MMRMSLKPIETFYGGYVFRSRLEARWARFWDMLDIRYFYEHEGFALPSGRYLPDFYLPDLNVWFEIKLQHQAGIVDQQPFQT